MPLGALLCLLLSLICPHAAGALEITPFYTRNQAPLMQIYGLPPAESGMIVPAGRTDGRLVFDAANIFTGGENEQNELRLDGESYRLTLVLRHALSKRLEVGLDLPYVWHTGGELDGVINSFHRSLDMPEGGRDLWVDDQIGYFWVQDGDARLSIDEPQDGFGDILISAGLEIYRQDGPGGNRSVALRPGLKLPSGSGKELTGSGSTDFSLRVAGTDALTLSHWRLTGFATLGGLAMTEGDVLADFQEDVVGFATLGLGWEPLRWLAVKVQLDGHTPFYDGSGLHHLDDPSLQITFGFGFSLPGEIVCDLGISEDIAVETAPDVAFHLSLWRRF